MAERTIDWLHIRREYVLPHFNKSGCPEYYTLDELARRFRLSRSTLGDHAASESWLQEREEVQRQIYVGAIKKYEDEFAQILSQADRDAAILAQEMIAFMRRRFRDSDTDEKVQMVKTWARPLQEILQVLHEAVGVAQVAANANANIEVK